MVVYASLFQPIQSRRGVDRVVRLRFPDDAGPADRDATSPRGRPTRAMLRTARPDGRWEDGRQLPDHSRPAQVALHSFA